MEILAEGDGITVLDHYAEFNCCLRAWMEVEIHGTEITVTEKEDPDKSDACFCVCPFELSIGISNLPDGLYRVRVYKEEIDGVILLLEQTVKIPFTEEPECVQDSDCPDGYVCRQNRCMEEPPIDPCLAAGGNCVVETPAGCPAGTHQLPPDTFVCGGAGGVICCVPGCLSDSDCAAGEMCRDGGCVEIEVDCITSAGYCWPRDDKWVCQCYEPGDSRHCQDADLSLACLDALEDCCSDGCRWMGLEPSSPVGSTSSMLNFGPVGVGQAVSRTAKVRNAGHSRITVTGFEFTEDSSPTFTLIEAPETPLVVHPGENVSLTVRELADDLQRDWGELQILNDCELFSVRLHAEPVGCVTHEDCLTKTSGQEWCVLGVCTPGETPCEAAGGICSIESECPEGFYPPKDPGFMHCAWCGQCCLDWGCPDLIDCPQGTTCSADRTCVPGF